MDNQINTANTNKDKSHAFQFSLLKLDRWNVSIMSIALLMALPVLVVASYLLQPFNENWTHLYENLLGDYVTNSLILKNCEID